MNTVFIEFLLNLHSPTCSLSLSPSVSPIVFPIVSLILSHPLLPRYINPATRVVIIVLAVICFCTIVMVFYLSRVTMNISSVYIDPLKFNSGRYV